MEQAVADVVEKLQKMSTRSRTRRRDAQVATVASNNDAEIGNLIADAMENVGKDGVITVDEGKSLKTEVEWVEGMQFDRGYLCPYFVTDPNKMEARAGGRLHPHQREEDLQRQGAGAGAGKVVNSGKPLLIVAEDIEGEALATLVINKLRGTFRWPPSRPPATATAARPCWKTSPS